MIVKKGMFILCSVFIFCMNQAIEKDQNVNAINVSKQIWLKQLKIKIGVCL